ncbi:PQQ-dependent sugar dehydrogenase [Candidatus Nitrosocosmicus sp. R]
MNKSTQSITLFVLLFILFSFSCSSSTIFLSYGAYFKAPASPGGPVLNDPNLVVEKVNNKPLNIPTSLAFFGHNDILVTEKETGKVIRVLDGQVKENVPLLDVEVATAMERGLLGLTLLKSMNDTKTYVFLYYTESGGGKDGDDFNAGVEPVGNRLYKYEYHDGKLINPTLLLDLPATPVNNKGEHNGGKVIIGPDSNIYTVIGDVGAHRTESQNVVNGPAADGTSGIIRLTPTGEFAGDPIFGTEGPLRYYYAMGIRNSFGMDFDPVSGTLWATENGPAAGDEINMVEPGFNSGWAQIQGFADSDILNRGKSAEDLLILGDAKYSDPEFSWNTTVGITDAKFFSSDKLGKQYENNLFVGDINNGYIYRFTLNSERNAIEINRSSYEGNLDILADKQVNTPKEVIPLIFGSGFGGITDLEVGPDGYLYVLTYFGEIYRIIPKLDLIDSDNSLHANKSQSPLTQTAPSVSNSTIVQIMGIEGDKSYNPNPVVVQEGQTILWVNGDAISHTVTSNSHKNGYENNSGILFDSTAILPGHFYSKVFVLSGTYSYYCFYHPTMIGQVIVE